MAAASTTSQMSIPIRSQSIASSLTSAMFTERKTFSSSFDSSAASGVGDRHDLVAHLLVQGDRPLEAGRGQPADDLRGGAQRVVGAARVDALGREATLKSRPAASPDSSSSGTSRSRVVPG